MNIYLDIDGVILANNLSAAYFANDFISYILKRWPNNTYWLTTHCWRGENRAIDILTPHLKSSTVNQLSLIKPTDWSDLKTDAIDFKQPFLWFDDDLFPEEEKILEHYDAIDCLRKIDLKHNPGQLIDEIAYLKTL